MISSRKGVNILEKEIHLLKEQVREFSVKNSELSIQKEILSTQNETLQKEAESLSQETEEQKNKIRELEETIAWFKRQIFGKKSERYVPPNPNQLTLFPLEEPVEEVTTRQVPAHTRKKPSNKSKIAIPKDLPVEREVLDLSEEEKVCKETGVVLVKIGEEVSQRLAYLPGRYFIKEVVRPKYAHPKKEEKGIYIAPLPDRIIPKCRLDESLIADVLVRKFVDHTPFYRVSEALTRDSVYISRQVLSDIAVKVGLALEPLYNLLTKEILSREYLFIDETPVKVQHKKEVIQGYTWVIANEQTVAFDFKLNRRHSNIPTILSGFSGYLHSDKYGGYEMLAMKKQIKWCPCFAHIRRKFFEAETHPEIRDWFLEKIKEIFLHEELVLSLSPDLRLAIRREKEEPIIDEIITKLKDLTYNGKALPKSKIYEAIRYAYSLIPYLKTYLEHPHARLDNNLAERALRPLAIGRKNWLFFGSEDGAKAGSILLSLLQTCRLNGINPRDYIEDILRRIMEHPFQRLHELLPLEWAKAHSVNMG